MPDSINYEDLRKLRQIRPKPIWAYSMLGDKDAERMARERVLVRGRGVHPIQLRPHEKVSRDYPYVVYNDVELKPPPPSWDDFPFQSYYYLMDYDNKGPIVAGRRTQAEPTNRREPVSTYLTPLGQYGPHRPPQRLAPSGPSKFSVRYTTPSAPAPAPAPAPQPFPQAPAPPAYETVPAPPIPHDVTPKLPSTTVREVKTTTKTELPVTQPAPAIRERVVEKKAPVPEAAAPKEEKKEFPWWIIPVAALLIGGGGGGESMI